MLSISCNGIVIYSLYQYVLSEEMSMDNKAKVEVVHNYYDEKVPASRYRRTVRYEAAKLSPEEYDILYELVTTNPFYSKKVELLRQVLKNYQFRKSCSNSPLPLVFKQAVYLLAYELCKGDYYNIAQKQVLRDIGLSLNSFTKWGMTPKNDFNAQLYLQLADLEPPTIIPLKYKGKKNMALIYLVSELSKQIKYNKFEDVFGGSSAVTVGISKKENAQYFINDISPSMIAVYETLRNHGNLLLETFSEIQDAIQRVSETEDLSNICLSLFPDVKAYEQIEQRKNSINDAIAEENREFLVDDKIFKDYLQCYREKYPNTVLPLNIYDDLSKIVTDYHVIQLQKKAFAHTSKINELKVDLSHLRILYTRELFNYFKNIKKSPEKYSIQQLGIATIFCLSFGTRLRADLTNIIKQESEEKIFNKKIWEQVIHEYQHYKIKILSQLDVNIVSDQNINCRNTLLYLDSPYIGTDGYNEANKEKEKMDKEKSSGYGRKEFKALHDKLATFKGYWIFSCRAGINYVTDKKGSIPKDPDHYLHKKDDLRFLFDLYSDIAKYVAFIRNRDESDANYFKRPSNREVMLLNFPAIAPDMDILRKLINGSINGANQKSVYRIISYEEFYPLAIKGLDPMN